MAFMPYFIIGPTTILGLIGLIRGPDRTIPTPAEDWKKATVDLVIPSYNEEKTIILCLSSIRKQSLQPRQIVLIDDASKDRTTEFAALYAEMFNLNLKIIKHEHNQGKTRAIYQMLSESDADVVALVDADTVIKSSNYLERLVQELFQGVGIACACGMVMPLTEKERHAEYISGKLSALSKVHPHVEYSPDKTWFELFQRELTNFYRQQLYLYLQRFVYKGEMIFFGTLIFPVGCAVVYRRKYLKNLFDFYMKDFGFDLTTSEDIFFGFAFDTEGYRCVGVQDIFALTTEPRFPKLYNQIFKWSSSFFQSCYYFNSLFLSPFRFFRVFIKKRKEKRNLKEILEKRKIKEAYRQTFGASYTSRYGRYIGWFIFSTAVEKISYPTFIVVFLLMRLWEPLLMTIVAESFLYSIVISFMHKNRRIENFFKSLLSSPIRYSQLLFELVVIANFILDLWVTKNRNWRK